MHVAVVIPCFNGRDLTRACLASLLAQHGAHDLEICLVDNASTDGTADLAAMSPSVRALRLPENRGFAGGVNAGIRATAAPFVLVLNNDTQAAPNLITELGRALTEHAGVGAVGPVSNYVKGPALLRVAEDTRSPEVRAELAGALQECGPAAVQDVETLSGLCLLVRRSTLDTIGLLDERFGHGNYEDDDFCLRMRLQGLRLLIARRAFLHHEGHATFKAIGLDYRAELDRRGAQFEAKWRDDPAGRSHLAAMRGDLVTAGEAAAIAATQWPSWPEAHWHRARLLAARGDAPGATAELETLLSICPSHSEAAVEHACLLLGMDHAEAARDALARLSQHCYVSPPQEVRLLRRVGEHEYATGRVPTATRTFRTALELAPADGALHNGLGLCLLATGDLDGAETEFLAAAQNGCDIAHTNLGLVAMQRGDMAGAGPHFARAAELHPADPAAKNNLAAFRARFPAFAGNA